MSGGRGLGRGALLAGLGLAGGLLYLAGLALGKLAGAGVGKPLPALALAGWALTPPRTAYARWIGAGLALSALGDVLLERDRLFRHGLLAFLLAHLAYTAGFLSGSRRLAPGRGLGCLAYGAAAYAFLRPGLGKEAPYVALYTAAISGMLWRAAARVGERESRPAEWAGAAGAATFAASDSLLALDRFHAPIPGVRWPIILLYWLGQGGIAASARLAAPRP